MKVLRTNYLDWLAFLCAVAIVPAQAWGGCSTCGFAQPSLQSLGARNGAASFSTFRNGLVQFNLRNRLREVQGFSNLLSDGKVLFERTLVPQGGRSVEVVRQLFINRGVLQNFADPLTRVQVRDFFLKNFNNFKGNDKRLVFDFLALNGAGDAFSGNVRVAIKGGILPPGVTLSDPKYKNIPPEVVNSAAVSFIINMLSDARNPLPMSVRNMFPDGTLRMNLTGAVDPAGLARLLNDNPYDCPDASGIRRGIVRADWLVTRALDPDIYYQVTGLSADQDEFADQVGFVDEKKFKAGGLLLMAGSRTKPETIVGRHPQRVLQWQQRLNSPGRFCFRSHDFTQDPLPGVEEASRDVFRFGVNFTADAGEWICQRANGFPIYELTAEANRQRANNAPAEIALQPGGNRVGVAEKCIKCHIAGFHGGRLTNLGQGADAKPYTDHFDRIPANKGREFFSRNAVYRNFQETSNFGQGQDYPAAAKNASIIQQNAMKVAGAYLADPTAEEEKKTNPYVQSRPLPVVSDMAEEYRKDLTVERQAQELGTTVDRVLAQQAQLANVTLPEYRKKFPQGQLVSRNEFANSYCIRRAQVGGGGFQPDQRNVGTPTETAPQHTPEGTGSEDSDNLTTGNERPTRPPADL